MAKNPFNPGQSLRFWRIGKNPRPDGTILDILLPSKAPLREEMKKQMLARVKSFKKRWIGDGLRGIGAARRLRSLYEGMNRSLKYHEPEPPAESCLAYEDGRRRQAVAGYLTGKILVALGVINAEQLAEALKRQRELQERGKRRSLGILLVEMGYTTSKEYLEALSRYFGLPVISLLKFIPSPAAQGLLAERYVHHHRLLILADHGTEVTMALAEPDPLILEELKKAFKNKEKINFYLANPFEVERCYGSPPDPFCVNFNR
jgi:hypothetical protein